MTKRGKKTKRVEAKPAEPLVNEFVASHGDYRDATIVDLNNELGDGRQKLHKVLLNRGGTAIDRWFRDYPRQFQEEERAAVRYCQSLWMRCEGISAIDHAIDRVSAQLGWSQQLAMTELATLSDRVPEPYWRCFENVCRFDQEAGTAGSALANNSRSAVDAARTSVAFTASLIAMWRRL